MCTVAFLPAPGGGFVLGHNRDELRTRSRGTPPRRFARSGRAFLAPRDPDGGGTWIGVNDAGAAMCLLNAAEKDPSRLPARPPSRGRILWELMDRTSVEDVEERLAAMRPRLGTVRAFHLVVATPGRRERGAGPARRGRTPSAARAVRFRWDGSRLTRDERDGPALFVSSGYDQRGAERERSAQWRAFLASGAPRGADALAGWLATHVPAPSALSVCMHRDRAASVSRTLVTSSASGIRLHYHDGPPCDPDAPECDRTLPLSAALE